MGSSWSSPIVWRNAPQPNRKSGGELLKALIRAQEGVLAVGNVKAPTACSVASDLQRIYFGGSDPMSKGPLFAVRSGASGTYRLS